jgi:hypothetical protein
LCGEQIVHIHVCLQVGFWYYNLKIKNSILEILLVLSELQVQFDQTLGYEPGPLGEKGEKKGKKPNTCVWVRVDLLSFPASLLLGKCSNHLNHTSSLFS